MALFMNVFSVYFKVRTCESDCFVYLWYRFIYNTKSQKSTLLFLISFDLYAACGQSFKIKYIIIYTLCRHHHTNVYVRRAYLFGETNLKQALPDYHGIILVKLGGVSFLSLEW